MGFRLTEEELVKLQNRFSKAEPEKKARKKPANPEHDLIQVPFFDCLRLNYEQYPFLQGIFAVPNAGKRSKFAGARLRQEGLVAGVWDVCVPFARRGFNMMWIEFKYGRNELTEEQEAFKERLSEESQYFRIFRCPYTAISMIEVYFGIGLDKRIIQNFKLS